MARGNEGRAERGKERKSNGKRGSKRGGEMRDGNERRASTWKLWDRRNNGDETTSL